ncbi:MAG: InlB B-repeat-containing protein, partial [Defluviitaleaceae bacterium]|nr:InlB B-repeat-containing protein [Defluviitaleaceae bacterium]
MCLTQRASCTFAGWYEYDGSDWGQMVTGNTHVPDGNITYYAKWQVIVTFDTNYGINPQQTAASYTVGGKYDPLPTPAPPVQGLVFDGWYTTIESSGGVHVTKSTDVISKHIILFARWKISVTFVSSYGMYVTTEYKIIGSEYGTLPDPIVPGKGFIGWYPDQNGTGLRLEIQHLVSVTDTVFYAQWAQYAVSITNYFDMGYQVYFGNSLGVEHENTSKENIYGYMQNVSNIYNILFGLNVAFAVPEPYISNVDICKQPNNDFEQREVLCSHAHSTCDNCTQREKLAAHFYINIPGPKDCHNINILWSGHK